MDPTEWQFRSGSVTHEEPVSYGEEVSLQNRLEVSTARYAKWVRGTTEEEGHFISCDIESPDAVFIVTGRGREQLGKTYVLKDQKNISRLYEKFLSARDIKMKAGYSDSDVGVDGEIPNMFARAVIPQKGDLYYEEIYPHV